MHSRRHRLISLIRRNIVGRLCIRPTIVLLIFSNQKARVRAITSAPPIFVYEEYVFTPTTLCQNNFEPKTSSHPKTPTLFARNFRWETLRWNILGARRTGKYVAATVILNQAFIAKITADKSKKCCMLNLSPCNTFADKIDEKRLVRDFFGARHTGKYVAATKKSNNRFSQF